jgi:uncharacterized protein with HEPN domain
MTRGSDDDALHVELILERIAAIRKSLQGATEADFHADADMVDLAAFRLATIGESVRKLSAALKDRHRQVAWDAIYKMRNILVHAYHTINPSIVWASLGSDLEILEAACRHEFDRLAK